MLPLFLLIIDDDFNNSKFESLYNEYHEMIYNTAFKITQNHYDAEDAMQETFLVIANDIKNIKIDNIAMLKSFLYKVTRNASIDILRRKNRTAYLNVDEFSFLPSDEDIDSRVEGNEQYKQIVKQISKMPILYRDVLSLYFLNDTSTKRISVILNRKHSTVKQH